MFGFFVFTEQQDSLPPDSQTEQEATQAQVHHIATTLNVLKLTVGELCCTYK